jgi:hypothetical protein
MKYQRMTVADFLFKSSMGVFHRKLLLTTSFQASTVHVRPRTYFCKRKKRKKPDITATYALRKVDFDVKRMYFKLSSTRCKTG